MQLPLTEPFRIKMVEPIFQSSREQREQWIREADWNLFNLKSNRVYIDLLTDSGTGAMSDRQWSEIMIGDESYAGASSYYKLKESVNNITGFEWFLPTHQGRAAENVLFSTLIREGDVIPGNSHFDTTKGHIELRKATAIDCPIDAAKNPYEYHPFKGNTDNEKLEKIIKGISGERIPLIIVTITNNTAGGQPVSMANLRETSGIAKKYGVKFFIDSARFAENAYFIKTREAGYSEKSIREIVKEMFSYADGMTMSSKKDGIVNMGGFLAFRDEDLFREASTYNIMFEGFNTYGGMSGRDMNALSQGLYEGTDFSYLESRVRQVYRLGTNLKSYGVPVLQPVGGHAVFVNASEFVPWIPAEEFPAQTLACEFFIEGGVRCAEIGTLMADRDPVTLENRYPVMEFVRLAIPRRVYTDNHIDYVSAVVRNVFERRSSIRHGLKIIWEAPIMRHFTVKLQKLE